MAWRTVAAYGATGDQFKLQCGGHWHVECHGGRFTYPDLFSPVKPRDTKTKIEFNDFRNVDISIPPPNVITLVTLLILLVGLCTT